MADLSELEAAQPVKMAGSDPVGGETNFLGVTSNQEVCNVDTQNGSYLSTVVTAGIVETEMKVGGSPLANRKELYLENVGNREAWIGPTGVTGSGLTRGRILERGDTMQLPFGPGINVYAITAIGTTDILVQESS